MHLQVMTLRLPVCLQKWKWSIRVDKGGGVPGVTLQASQAATGLLLLHAVVLPTRHYCTSRLGPGMHGS